ncbi:MAG: hypothetical protein AAGI88_01900 [Pseudomonadota bacterium]
MSSPIIGLDHVVVCVSDLDRASRCYATLFASKPMPLDRNNASHGVMFQTQNTCLCLVETGTTHVSTGLKRAGFLIDSIDRARRRFTRLGIKEREPAGSELVVTRRQDLMAEVTNTDQHQWSRGLDLRFVQTPTGSVYDTEKQSQRQGERALGLDHLVIASSDPQATAFLCAAQLGLDLRLDLENPKWGGRFLFFRCGDLIIEVVHGLKGSPNEDVVDQFYGLSWRVKDAQEVQASLQNEGFLVSELRDGRKPGTLVFTLQDKCTGTPTLVLQPA